MNKCILTQTHLRALNIHLCIKTFSHVVYGQKDMTLQCLSQIWMVRSKNEPLGMSKYLLFKNLSCYLYYLSFIHIANKVNFKWIYSSEARKESWVQKSLLG